MPEVDDDLSKADRAALTECLRLARADPSHRRQIEEKITECGLREASEHACYIIQCRALNLKPWESPPCWGNDEDVKSIALLDGMLAAGLSQWEPDPMRALAMRKKR